jgi:hypothetical protein
VVNGVSVVWVIGDQGSGPIPHHPHAGSSGRGSLSDAKSAFTFTFDPNPAAGTVRPTFALPQPAHVRIGAYDARGR